MKICDFNIFYIYLQKKAKLIILKMIGKMENKGYELQQEFYRQDSILFDELIEANSEKGGNNG